ncbi:MAG: ArsR/SmtB family transcription factor [Fervidobacterium sp.]
MDNKSLNTMNTINTINEINTTDFQALGESLKILAHPIRLKILYLLKSGEMCVCEMLPFIGISQPNLSQHLGLLKLAGFLVDRRKGNSIYYSLVRNKITEKILELIDEAILKSK